MIGNLDGDKSIEIQDCSGNRHCINVRCIFGISEDQEHTPQGNPSDIHCVLGRIPTPYVYHTLREFIYPIVQDNDEVLP
jgi:hypothetical protein